MKIGIVCFPTFGGSGVVATELGIALSKRGYEIHFITYRQPVRLDLLENNIHFHEVLIKEYPLFQYLPYELALSSKLVEVIKTEKLDLLHVHYAIPHAYAAFMAKQILKQEGISIPVITTLHGTDITLVGSHPSYKTAVTFSINNSDVVTCVSQSLKQDTERLFETKKEIYVIPNFVDNAKYGEDNLSCHRTSMASKSQRIVTHISNFRKVKRIPDVIKIFRNILKVIDSRLIMVGEGPEREHAEQLCKDLDIAKNVLFLGNSNEVRSILSFTDLMLLPSETESFGLSALEAMASGVPVVSTNSGGLPEVNIQGVSGYLCDVGDVETLSAKSIEILKDDDVLKKFKCQAKAQATKFDITSVLPMYEQLYTKTLENIPKNNG